MNTTHFKHRSKRARPLPAGAAPRPTRHHQPKRKLTGYHGWRFGDGFLLRGNAAEYDLLINRANPRLSLFEK